MYHTYMYIYDIYVKSSNVRDEVSNSTDSYSERFIASILVQIIGWSEYRDW